ncbi:MAG TPA: LCP family protein [Acidimicrobiia bacterium]|nr:LCP family protein [Acidimicrobiia bacterium]
MRQSRPLGPIVALLVTVAACGGGEAATTTTTVMPTTTTSAPTTTTTLGPTTTMAPQWVSVPIEMSLEGDDEAAEVLADFYAWIGDRSHPTPAAAAGLLDHLADVHPESGSTFEAELHAAEVEGGRVAVVTAGDDVVLLADEGSGWRVVGADLARFDLDPWFGEEVRHVLVLGTDARPGESQPLYRADSIHILSSNSARGGGSILGFPRDTYVEASYGFDKFTHVNALAETHSSEMVDIAERISGLPIEGYILTGFTNFRRLVDQFGGVVVDVPYFIDDWRAEAYILRGVQRLFGDDALGFSRTRRITGGDFARSANQGKVILAALVETLGRDITQLPTLIAILIDNTWTDLSPGDLLTLGATAFLVDPQRVTNEVLPGSVELRNGSSVVILDDAGADAIFDDLRDGILDG